MMNSATNTVVLEGVVATRDVIRVTPGGLAALNLTLTHQSQQAEGNSFVQVEAEINAVAFGEVAEALNAVKVADQLTVKGFLSQKNRYNSMLILHITQFKYSN